MNVESTFFLKCKAFITTDCWPNYYRLAMHTFTEISQMLDIPLILFWQQLMHPTIETRVINTVNALLAASRSVHIATEKMA